LNKKENKINTIFVDEETNCEIDPFSLLNKPCSVTAAIKFESIFIGNKISLQVKLYEVVVRQINNSMRGLLRPNAQKYVAEDHTKSSDHPANLGKPIAVNVYNDLGIDDDDEDDEGVPSSQSITPQVGGEEESDDDDDDSIVMEGNTVEVPVEPVQSVVEKLDISKSAAPKGKKAPPKPRAKK
jgi:hypothetical protein